MSFCSISPNGRYILSHDGAEVIRPNFYQWDITEYSSRWAREVADPTTFTHYNYNSAYTWTLAEFFDVLTKTSSNGGILVPSDCGWVDSWSGSTPSVHASFATNFQQILNLAETFNTYIIIESLFWFGTFDNEKFTGSDGGIAHPWHTSNGGPFGSVLELHNAGFANNSGYEYYENAVKEVMNSILGMTNNHRILGIIMCGEGASIKYQNDAPGDGPAWAWWKSMQGLFKDLCTSEGWGDILLMSHWDRTISMSVDPTWHAENTDLDIIATENYNVGYTGVMYNTPHEAFDLIETRIQESFDAATKPVWVAESAYQGWFHRHPTAVIDPASEYSIADNQKVCRQYCGILGNETLRCDLGLTYCTDPNAIDSEWYSYHPSCPSKDQVTMAQSYDILRAGYLTAIFNGACLVNQWGSWVNSTVIDIGPISSNSPRKRLGSLLNTIFTDIISTSLPVYRIDDQITLSDTTPIQPNPWNTSILVTNSSARSVTTRKAGLMFQSGNTTKLALYLLNDNEGGGTISCRITNVGTPGSQFLYDVLNPTTNSYTSMSNSTTLTAQGHLDLSEIPVSGTDVIIVAESQSTLTRDISEVNAQWFKHIFLNNAIDPAINYTLDRVHCTDNIPTSLHPQVYLDRNNARPKWSCGAPIVGTYPNNTVMSWSDLQIKLWDNLGPDLGVGWSTQLCSMFASGDYSTMLNGDPGNLPQARILAYMFGEILQKHYPLGNPLLNPELDKVYGLESETAWEYKRNFRVPKAFLYEDRAIGIKLTDEAWGNVAGLWAIVWEDLDWKVPVPAGQRFITAQYCDPESWVPAGISSAIDEVQEPDGKYYLHLGGIANIGKAFLVEFGSMPTTTTSNISHQFQQAGHYKAQVRVQTEESGQWSEWSTEYPESGYIDVIGDNPQINTFYANPPTVNSGNTSTLHWTTQNGIQIHITGDNGDSYTSSDSGTISSGSWETSVLTSDTNYTLELVGYGGSVYSSITVSVITGSVSITSFTADANTVIEGETTTLRWATAGATSITITPSVSGPLPLPTSGYRETNPINSDTTFILSATDGVDTVQASLQVTVTTEDVPIIQNITNDIPQVPDNSYTTDYLGRNQEWQVTISCDPSTTARVHVDWGDGGPTQNGPWMAGGGTTTFYHQYNTEGVYTATFWPESQTGPQGIGASWSNIRIDRSPPEYIAGDIQDGCTIRPDQTQLTFNFQDTYGGIWFNWGYPYNPVWAWWSTGEPPFNPLVVDHRGDGTDLISIILEKEDGDFPLGQINIHVGVKDFNWQYSPNADLYHRYERTFVVNVADTGLPPTQPQPISPTGNATNICVWPYFSWTASVDPQGWGIHDYFFGDVTYGILLSDNQLAINENWPAAILVDGLENTHYQYPVQHLPLSNYKMYYWKVWAEDSDGNKTFSTTQRFTTERTTRQKLDIACGDFGININGWPINFDVVDSVNPSTVETEARNRVDPNEWVVYFDQRCV